MSKHTPGPWRWMAVNGNPDALMVVAGAIGECGICHVINRPAGTKDQPTTEHPHNARLIAAAPELLAALKNLLDYSNGYADEMRNLGLGAGQLGERADSVSVAGMARAAIAKAEGGDR